MPTMSIGSATSGSVAESVGVLPGQPSGRRSCRDDAIFNPMSPFNSKREPPKLSPEAEAEIEAASVITSEDIARAKAAWRKHAPPEAKDLLDAQTYDGTDTANAKP